MSKTPNLSESGILKDEIDLLDYVRILVRYRKTIFFSLLICLIITVAISVLSGRIYETSAIVRIGSISNPLMTKQEAIEIIRDKSLFPIVISRLNKNVTMVDLENMLTKHNLRIEGIRNGEFIEITVKNKDNFLARDICNAIAESFVDLGRSLYAKKESLVEEKIKEYEKQKGKIDYQLNSLYIKTFNKAIVPDSLIIGEINRYARLYLDLVRMSYSLKDELIDSKNFTIIKLALLPKEYIKLGFSKRIAILLLGLMLGLLIAFLQEFWNNNF